MRGVPLQAPERWWECPNCDQTAVTRDLGVANNFHNCKGLLGLSAPMVPAGTRAKVEAREREDFIGREQVQTVEVDGKARPIMSIITTRDEGQDCTVLAPMASGLSETE